MPEINEAKLIRQAKAIAKAERIKSGNLTFMDRYQSTLIVGCILAAALGLYITWDPLSNWLYDFKREQCLEFNANPPWHPGPDGRMVQYPRFICPPARSVPQPAPTLAQPLPATEPSAPSTSPPILSSIESGAATVGWWIGVTLVVLAFLAATGRALWWRRWWLKTRFLIRIATWRHAYAVRSDAFRRTLSYPWGNDAIKNAVFDLVMKLYYLEEKSVIPKCPGFFRPNAEFEETCKQLRPISQWARTSPDLQAFYRELAKRMLQLLASVFPEGAESTITVSLKDELSPQNVEDFINLLQNPKGYGAPAWSLYEANREYLSQREVGKALSRIDYSRGDRLRPADGKLDPIEFFRKTPFEEFFKTQIPYVIDESARWEHGIIVGGQGSGKSQTIEALILNDLRQADPPSIVLLDMKNDIVRRLAHLEEFHPEHGRLKDRLIILDINDRPELGIFAGKNRTQLMRSVEYFFQSMIQDEVSGGQQAILKALLQLMDVMEDPSLSKLRDALEEPKRYIDDINCIPDADTRKYFLERFSSSGTQTRDALARRIDQILNDPIQKAIYGSSRLCVDFVQALNSGKIILVVPRSGGATFGRFILGQVIGAGWAREHIPEHARKTVHVYVDEADPYVSSETMELFDRMRSYRIGCMFAFLNTNKMQKWVNDILGGVPIKIAGGVSRHDAQLLAANMGQTLTAFVMEHAKPERRAGRRAAFVRFALYVDGAMRGARTMQVATGQVEKSPQLSEADYERVVAANRQRLAISRPEEPEEEEPTPAPVPEPAPAESALVSEPVVRQSPPGQGKVARRRARREAKARDNPDGPAHASEEP